MVDNELQFQVIGPLRVWRSGVPVRPPRSAVLRGLLGVLLLADGDPLPAERLSTAVWGGGHEGAVGKGAVQVAVSRLRSWLHGLSGPDPAVAVEHAGDGYRLLVSPEHLDLARLRALLDSTDAITDPARRFTALRPARDLCQAPVLADLPSVDHNDPLLVSANHAVRAGALAFGGAALAAGEAAEAVPPLERLAEAWPFDEPIHASLLKLLEASEQPAAALLHYERLRSRLADELGVAPSEAVQDAYLSVLARDRSTRDTTVFDGATTDTPPGGPKPAQLPPAAVGFAGRGVELAWLDARLRSPAEPAPIFVVIDGTAGIGKTSLAVFWAHRVRDQFPDGQLFVHLRGHATAAPLAPLDALAGMLRALGEPADHVPVEVDEAGALLRSRLADRRVLVLLDDAHSAEQVRPLLPATARGLAVVTSRHRLGGLVAREGAHRLHLDVLTESDAALLLTHALGGERVAAEPQAVADLVQACACLPLALRIAAANTLLRPAFSLAEQVRLLREGNRLATLEVPGDEHHAVRAAFALSYAGLDPGAQALFRRLGLPPGPDISAEAAATLAGQPVEKVRPTLERLVDAALLSEHQRGRYAFHDLLRLYAAERAEQLTAGERATALERYHQWCMFGVDEAARRLLPHALRLPWPPRSAEAPAPAFADAAQAMAWLDAERPNLVAVVVQAARHGPRPMAWLLADALRLYFWKRVNHTDWRTVAEAGLAAADADGDARARAMSHIGMAELLRARSRYREAVGHLTDAARLCGSVGWAEGEASALGALASAHGMLGELLQAADRARAALALSRRIGSVAGESANLGRLGMVHFDLGRLREAAEFHHTALVVGRKAGNRLHEAISAGNLGETYVLLGRFDDAAELLDLALVLRAEFGNEIGKVHVNSAFAGLHRDRGRLDEAMACARSAVAQAEDRGDLRLLADAHNALASVAARRGECDDALHHHQRALELARTAGAGYSELAALVGLADTCHRLGRPDDAFAHAELASRRARQAGHLVLEGQALTVLALICRSRRQPDDALTHAQRAVSIHGDTGHWIGGVRAHRALAGALDDLGRSAEAARHRRLADAIEIEIGAVAFD
jgi:DNA-binding SARP family transcriptional activator